MCVLVVCGVTIVREYSLSTSYKEAKCTLTAINTHKRIECLYCGTGQKGESKKGSCENTLMPCLELLVNYPQGNGILHPDSIQATGRYSKV